MKFNLAPTSIGLRRQIWLWRVGRKDRKTYSESLDGTSTHAIIQIQGIAQAGQHHVNEAFLRESSRLLAANAVTSERLRAKEQEINDSVMKVKSLNGRKRDAETGLQVGLRNQLSELKNQLAANSKLLDSLASQAQQALDSWGTYYDVLASQYVRHRMKLRKGTSPAPAKVPTFESIALPEIGTSGTKEAKGVS